MMAHELQKQLQHELLRIPRSLKGSPQNMFRQYFSVHRLMGHSFEASVEKATADARNFDPGFAPRILPTPE